MKLHIEGGSQLEQEQQGARGAREGLPEAEDPEKFRDQIKRAAGGA